MKNNFRLYRKFNLYLYKILAGNVSIQITFLVVSFLIIFFGLQLFLGVDDSLLFHQMTAYEYSGNEENPLGLKLIYLVGVTFFSGFFVMILTNGVRNELDRIVSGDARFYFKNHIIFFGYNEEAEQIIEELQRDRKKPVKSIERLMLRFGLSHNQPDILIIVAKDVIATREKIEGHFGKLSCLHVLHGANYNIQDLQKFYIHLATDIYIIGNNEGNSDIENLDLYENIYNVLSIYRATINNIYLFLHDNSSLIFFRNRRWGGETTTDIEMLDNPNLKIINVDELWAQEIFTKSYHDITKGKITKESDKKLHVVIIGMSNTGETIALSIAKYCHFPNYITKGLKTKVTIIDKDFKKDRGILHGRYADFLNKCTYSFERVIDGKLQTIISHVPSEDDDITDIEWEFVESVPDETFLQDMLALFCLENNEILSVFICGHNDSQNINIALGLPKIYYDKEITIWTYSTKDYSINHYLEGSRYSNIRLWGMAGAIQLYDTWSEKAAIALTNNILTFGDKYFWDKCCFDIKHDRIDSMTAAPLIVENMQCTFQNEQEEYRYREELEIYAQLEHVHWVVTRLIDGYRPLNNKEINDIPIDMSNPRTDSQKHFFNRNLTHFKEINESLLDYNKEYIKFMKNHVVSNPPC